MNGWTDPNSLDTNIIGPHTDGVQKQQQPQQRSDKKHTLRLNSKIRKVGGNLGICVLNLQIT